MKIIGRRERPYSRGEFIVEMTGDELTLLAIGSTYPEFKGNFGNVLEVEICEKFQHAMRVIEACNKALKVPSQLEAVAECLRIVVPKIESIIEVEPENEQDA